MRRLERRLRLATGLIIACFVVGHFLNHSLGVVSIDAMDRVRSVLAAWWRSPVGTVLLYGSLLTHFALALVSLYRRTTLRMPAWEAAQLVLGLAVPPLLIAHIVGTRFYWFLLGHQIGYERMVGVLWSETGTALRQSILLLIVWTHFCFGIHYWLRLQRWYASAQPYSPRRSSSRRWRSPALPPPATSCGPRSSASAASRSTTWISPA